ncbi:MAG: hypothetical protein ACJAX7_002475 [Saprospiraceae bacterium]|jgi:hypothetical protein
MTVSKALTWIFVVTIFTFHITNMFNRYFETEIEHN